MQETQTCTHSQREWHISRLHQLTCIQRNRSDFLRFISDYLQRQIFFLKAKLTDYLVGLLMNFSLEYCCICTGFQHKNLNLILIFVTSFDWQNHLYLTNFSIFLIVELIELRQIILREISEVDTSLQNVITVQWLVVER